MSSRAPPTAAARVVTIDLAQLAANWRALAALARPAACAAVVKADAYGLGAARVVPALAAAGCRTFFVATFDEAVAVRAVVPSANANMPVATRSGAIGPSAIGPGATMAGVYVLDGLLPGTAARLIAAGVAPVLGTLAEVREWAAACRAIGKRYRAAIQINSGMNRTGLEPAECDALIAEPGLLAAFEPAFVMSHLACADDPAAALNGQQLAAFQAAGQRFKAVAGFEAVPLSLAASAGMLLGREYYFDLVRPGYAVYGAQPSAVGARLPVKPAVTVEARVLSVRDVERGGCVGYGAMWTAQRRSRIATLAIGYADGFARSAGGDQSGGLESGGLEPGGVRAGSSIGDVGRGLVAFGGQLVPVIGRVSMDLVTIDVTDLADRAPTRGDLVEVIGPTVTLADAARAAGTLGYEVLTRLSQRATRVYRDGPPDHDSTAGASDTEDEDTEDGDTEDGDTEDGGGV